MRTIDNRTRRILQDPKKRWAWIIYQLALQGSSLAAVARKAGLTRSAAYLARCRAYPRMEKLIAEALDMTAPQLFPDRYGPDGLPNRILGRPHKEYAHAKSSGRARTRNIHRVRAA